jgi:hypothetical protein
MQDSESVGDVVVTLNTERQTSVSVEDRLEVALMIGSITSLKADPSLQLVFDLQK